MKKFILTKEEQVIFDRIWEHHLICLKARSLHPIYLSKSAKIAHKIISPGAVLKTKSGKIKRFRMRKLK